MKNRSLKCVLGATIIALVLLVIIAPTARASVDQGAGKTTNMQLNRNSSFFSFDVGWLAMAVCWDRMLLALWFAGLVMATVIFK